MNERPTKDQPKITREMTKGGWLETRQWYDDGYFHTQRTLGDPDGPFYAAIFSEEDMESAIRKMPAYEAGSAEAIKGEFGVVEACRFVYDEPKRRNPIRKPRYGTKPNRWGS